MVINSVRMLSKAEAEKIRSGVLSKIGEAAKTGLKAVGEGVGTFTSGFASGFSGDKFLKQTKEANSAGAVAKRLGITEADLKEEVKLGKVLKATENHLNEGIKVTETEDGIKVSFPTGESKEFTDQEEANKTIAEYRTKFTAAVLKKNGLGDYIDAATGKTDLDVDVKASRKPIEARNVFISNRVRSYKPVLWTEDLT